MRARALLVVLGLVAAGLYLTAGAGPPAMGGQPPPESLLAPGGTDGYVWPYTSRTRSVEGRTLALNAVVLGDVDRVRRSLVDRSGTDWDPLEPNATVDISPWRQSHGSVRYTYVARARNGPGRWVSPDYQLEVGTYFGRRTHVRAYAGPSGEWTVLQAHTEYWDWFRVRHTVTGVEAGARFLEDDLGDEPFVEGVSRTHHGREGGGSDGWWSVIELAPAVLVAGALIAPRIRRLTASDAVLPVSLLGLVLGVRAWGLAAGALFPGANPKLFVVIGYPVLAIGPPAVVPMLTRDGRGARAAALAMVGLGAGVLIDLAAAGVRRPPTHLAGQRLALVVAIGTVALGIGRGQRRFLVVGLVAWLLALIAPLLGGP